MRIWFFTLLAALPLWAQTPASEGIPASLVLTLGHHYGKAPPELKASDLVVDAQGATLPITKLVPLRSALELYLLVDNCSNCEPGSKFEEIRGFILAQASTTKVGVAYMENGELRIAQMLTTDHKKAVSALSVPSGSKPANPYGPVTELIQNWPQSEARRAVVMISNGINPGARNDAADPAAEALIATAQKSRIPIYAIYHPNADYDGTDSAKLYAAQVQLSHVATESGGEAYFLYFGPLPSLAPFLNDIAEHLTDQYLIEFLASPAANNDFESVSVRSKDGDIELVAAPRVWVSRSR